MFHIRLWKTQSNFGKRVETYKSVNLVNFERASGNSPVNPFDDRMLKHITLSMLTVGNDRSCKTKALELIKNRKGSK